MNFGRRTQPKLNTMITWKFEVGSYNVPLVWIGVGCGLRTRSEIGTPILSTYKGTSINWQSTNNLQHKEEFKCYVDQISSTTTFKIFASTYELEADNTLRLSFTRT